jgi:hypothetical protein
MRDLYLAYRDKPKLQPLVAEISWAKNLVILGRCKDDLEREFHLRATARLGWTRAVVQHQVEGSRRSAQGSLSVTMSAPVVIAPAG